jgi:hypothetical protein
MSSIVSRWPVVITRTIGVDDLAHGRLTQAAVRRLGDEAVDALIAIAPLLSATERRASPTSAQLNGTFAAAGDVTISASAAEIYPASVEVAVRIRPADGSGSSVDAVWSLAVDGGVSAAVRDELIALVHAARHAH